MNVAEACDLAVDLTRQICLAQAERDEARAERDETRAWLRASLRSSITLTRDNDHLRAENRRLHQQYHDLRVERLLQSGVEV
jgi:hypothetical protein